MPLGFQFILVTAGCKSLIALKGLDENRPERNIKLLALGIGGSADLGTHLAAEGEAEGKIIWRPPSEDGLDGGFSSSLPLANTPIHCLHSFSVMGGRGDDGEIDRAFRTFCWTRSSRLPSPHA